MFFSYFPSNNWGGSPWRYGSYGGSGGSYSGGSINMFQSQYSSQNIVNTGIMSGSSQTFSPIGIW